MKKVSLAGLAFVVLFVLMSTAQAQSPTDREFIAKLNGARYVHDFRVAIGTRDIQGNKIIPGQICTDSRCGGPLGEWAGGYPTYYINGRGYTVPEYCLAGRTTMSICKISEDSITCVGGCDGEQIIWTREH